MIDRLPTVGTDRLRERMNGQYWRIARRRRLLHFIGRIFRDDLTINPLQYEVAVSHLVKLRRAVEGAHQFYSTLDPESTKLVQPWGTLAKLADFEAQVTELLLYIIALQQASAQEQVFVRVQLHLVVRRLFPVLLVSFDDLTSQLKALPGKAAQEAVKQVLQAFLKHKLPSRSEVRNAVLDQYGIALTWNEVADICYLLRHELEDKTGEEKSR